MNTKHIINNGFEKHYNKKEEGKMHQKHTSHSDLRKKKSKGSIPFLRLMENETLNRFPFSTPQLFKKKSIN